MRPSSTMKLVFFFATEPTVAITVETASPIFALLAAEKKAMGSGRGDLTSEGGTTGDASGCECGRAEQL